MSNQAQAPEFFNLHTNGIGYLNRIRWVNVKSGGRKAEPFLACSIAALRGRSDEVSYTYFDLRVSGQEAVELVSSLEEAVKAQKKVLVNFRIGDIYPHTYERDVRDGQNRPTGQKEWTSIIKGRLILINAVKVDGELVYQREEGDAAPVGQRQETAEAPAQAAEAPEAIQRPQPDQRQVRQAYQPRRAYA